MYETDHRGGPSRLPLQAGSPDAVDDEGILLSESPVRHWKDGALGNQLSKASLLLAGDALRERFQDHFC